MTIKGFVTSFVNPLLDERDKEGSLFNSVIMGCCVVLVLFGLSGIKRSSAAFYALFGFWFGLVWFGLSSSSRRTDGHVGVFFWWRFGG